MTCGGEGGKFCFEMSEVLSKFGVERNRNMMKRVALCRQLLGVANCCHSGT